MKLQIEFYLTWLWAMPGFCCFFLFCQCFSLNEWFRIYWKTWILSNITCSRHESSINKLDEWDLLYSKVFLPTIRIKPSTNTSLFNLCFFQEPTNVFLTLKYLQQIILSQMCSSKETIDLFEAILFPNWPTSFHWLIISAPLIPSFFFFFLWHRN